MISTPTPATPDPTKSRRAKKGRNSTDSLHERYERVDPTPDSLTLREDFLPRFRSVSTAVTETSTTTR